MRGAPLLGSKFSHATMLHPCFNPLAHFNYARLHLPVAPRCNIQCGYCKRGLNKCEVRPGVASKVLSPKEALERVKRAVEEWPNLTVVGVAGPGDPLANEETFITLNMVHTEFPHLIKCIATNGLALPDNVDRLVEVGVRTVTVTVNGVSPEVCSKIYEWVSYGGRKFRGVKAAKLLIERQLEGIELATARGLRVKVNTVLIPGVNDRHVVEVAKEVAKLGAQIMNIIPLIPLHRFKDHRPPTCEELKAAREACSKYIPQFRLCKLCRADACGVPGFEPGLASRLLGADAH